MIQELEQAVAIAEEFPHSLVGKVKSGGPLFDRRVARVITPGTLVDEKFIDPNENNFLLAIYAPLSISPQSSQDATASEDITATGNDRIGLAWVDLSTGELYTQQASHRILASAVARIGAKEIIVDSRVDQSLLAVMRERAAPAELVSWTCRDSITEEDWVTLFDQTGAAASHAQFQELEKSAVRLLLDYVNDRLQGIGAKLQPPLQYQETENMGIDSNTMKGLEILETSREAISGGKGSLLHSLRRTVSNGGARLLRTRLSSPSTSLTMINKRLDLVEAFFINKFERTKVRELLKGTFDTQRLVQKFSLGRGDADDLVSLYKTIAACRAIKATIEYLSAQILQGERGNRLGTSLTEIVNRISLEGPDILAARIAEAIDEDGLLEHHRREEAQAAAALDMARDVISSQGDVDELDMLPRTAKGKVISPSLRYPDGTNFDSWRMRKAASLTLAGLHAELDSLLEKKQTLESELQQELRANSLTLRWTPGQGHICHVKGLKDVKSSTEQLPSARNASTSKSTRSFYHTAWTRLGTQIDQQRLRIIAEEDQLFAGLRDAVIQNLVRLRRNATVLDELDIACASATLAEEEKLIRPVLTSQPTHHIIGGRHATVKLGLAEQGRAFVSNDCSLGLSERIWLITGPNMAGKSTFLRQNALLSVLTQVGLFVPAEYAEIGIVDHIFCRIGSADNLYRDQSTFMVEMLESAHILRNATDKSLVIMDEVGRGTTPDDGTAVAYACLHHLYYVNRCRTLFATHFHDLADMAATWDALGRYCTDITEDPTDGSFHYDYRLRKGVNRESHALKVARLAGMPAAVIDVAKSILQANKTEDGAQPQQACSTVAAR